LRVDVGDRNIGVCHGCAARIRDSSYKRRRPKILREPGGRNSHHNKGGETTEFFHSTSPNVKSSDHEKGRAVT
jgi:hypothetical protein